MKRSASKMRKPTTRTRRSASANGAKSSPKTRPTVNHHSGEISPDSSAVASHDATQLFQSSPSQHLRYRPMEFVNRSPTDSLDSRDNWAFKQCRILDMNHELAPPTHEATIHFNRPATVSTIKSFLLRFRKALQYFCKSTNQSFAVWCIMESSQGKRIHFHLLIRTTVRFPREILKPMVTEASETIASLEHCEAVENVPGATRYFLKHLRQDNPKRKGVRLLKKRLGLHLCRSWNGYFVRPKKQLWADWIRRTFPPK